MNMNKKYSNKYVLETGIGLQDVDGLKNSHYFIAESQRYINGEISLKELDEIISSYYKNKPDVEERSEEADKISIRIARIISEDSFAFTVGQLVSIHKTLFDGVFEHAGKLRSYNFTKKEWVLNGASVIYGDYRVLEETLQYDFNLEKKFRYYNLPMDDVIEHLAIFIANLWQIHVFEEGNTRTTAVFVIKYLRSLGFDVTNDTFAKNAWYFRNSLVRANYNNIQNNVFADRTYLIKFLRNLLLGENNILSNRELRIDKKKEEQNNNQREDQIISIIRSNAYVRIDDIAKALDVSSRTIKTAIKGLEEKKVLKRVDGKKHGHWKIMK